MKSFEGKSQQPPSVEELKELFSYGDDVVDINSGAVEDFLVHTALGFEQDDGYHGMAMAILDKLGVEPVARAEARLQDIDDFDMRPVGYPGCYLDEARTEHRMARIGALVHELNDRDKRAYYEAFDQEALRLKQDPATVDASLLGQKPPEE